MGLVPRGRRNAGELTLKNLRLDLCNLPAAFDGFRILHLTDFHFDEDTELARRVRDLTAPIEADLCVLTGDYLWGHEEPYDHVFEQMRTLCEGIRSRHGIFGVLGNHDLAAFIGPFRELGVRILVNEHERLQVGDDHIWVAGVDDPNWYQTGDVGLTLNSIPETDFVLLLAHSPEEVVAASKRGVDLYLSGHTHAGQIRLPLLGPISSNMRAPRRLCQGLWRYKGMQGYTSSGIGTTQVPVRYNCPPEVVVFELRKT